MKVYNKGDTKMTLKSFIQNKKIIWWFLLLLIEEIILFIVQDIEFLSDTNVYVYGIGIKNAYLFAALSFIICILVVFILYTKETHKHLECEIIETNNEREKYAEAIKILHDEKFNDEGTKLLNQAMALDTFEPNKIKLLAEAADKYNNTLAGLYLGNLYHSGLYNGSVEIVKKDYDKAFYYYNKVALYDYTGAVLWRLGWMYERSQIAKDMDDTKRKQEALKYYKLSEKFEYVKSYNSLGKFYQNGWGVEKDLNEAIYYFKKATKNGDTFSVLNEAYIHAEKPESFDLAIKCFKHAMDNKTPLSYLKFGEFLEENINHSLLKNYNYDYNYIFNLYKTTIETNNGTLSARAYYNIGKLLDSNPVVIVENKQDLYNMFGNNTSDFVKAAYLKSKELFDLNIKKNVQLTDTSSKIYYSLLEILKQLTDFEY